MPKLRELVDHLADTSLDRGSSPPGIVDPDRPQGGREVPRDMHAQSPRRIVRVPGVCGGDPTIEGTRVPVASVVIQWKYYKDLDRVLEAYPHLDIPSIQAALRFYEKHQDEIDLIIRENEEAAYSPD